MQRDDVEEPAMRGLENLNQDEQTNRHYGCGGAQTYLPFAETRTSAELSVSRMGIHRESYYAYLPPSQIIAGEMEAMVRA